MKNINHFSNPPKNGLKIFLVVIFIILLCIVGRIFIRKAYASNYETPEGAVSASDWMKEIDGSLPLNLINIPGAHDCATNYVQFPYFAQCQYLPVSLQLEKGIRFLDVRLAIDEESDTLHLVHSFATCKNASGFSGDTYMFDELLSSCYAFLTEHPTETIIMNLKQDTGDPNTIELQTRIMQYVNENPSFWYLVNEMPNLDEVRGQIVLCHRYDDEANLGNEQSGLDLSWIDMPGAYNESDNPCNTEDLTWGGKILVQDHYEYDNDAKCTVVNDAFVQANALTNEEREQTVFLNFLSTKGTTFAVGTPYPSATRVNPYFLNLDKSDYDWLGWVIMDFATEELTREVFETNFNRIKKEEK